jgi:hypothetical protein
MQGLRSQKKRSLHEVNEHFFDKRNAAGGHYGQTLFSLDGTEKRALQESLQVINDRLSCNLNAAAYCPCEVRIGLPAFEYGIYCIGKKPIFNF